MKTLLITSLIFASVGLASANTETPASDKKAAMKAKMLEQFDANKDGKLDETERAAAKAARPKGKGKGERMSKEQRKAKMLEKFDTNKDGQLDETERATMKKAIEAKRAAKGTDSAQ